jgi:hypothetical protein
MFATRLTKEDLNTLYLHSAVLMCDDRDIDALELVKDLERVGRTGIVLRMKGSPIEHACTALGFY